MKIILRKFFEFNKFLFFILIFYLCVKLFISPIIDSNYFQKDVEFFNKQYYGKITIFGILILFVISLIYSLIKKKSLQEFLISSSGTLLYSFLFFFLLNPIINDFCLMFNKIEVKKPIKTNYKVIYNDNNKNFIAQNIENEKDCINERDYLKYMNMQNNGNFKKGDTIQINMQIGALGIRFIDK